MSKALIIIHKPRSPQFGAFLCPDSVNLWNCKEKAVKKQSHRFLNMPPERTCVNKCSTYNSKSP